MNGFPTLMRVAEMVFEVADDPLADCLRITPKTVGSPVPEAGGLLPVVPQTLDFSRRKHPVRRVSDHQPSVVSDPRSDDDGCRSPSRTGCEQGHDRCRHEREQDARGPSGRRDLQSRETVRQNRMTELHDDVPKPSTTALASTLCQRA